MSRLTYQNHNDQTIYQNIGNDKTKTPKINEQQRTYRTGYICRMDEWMVVIFYYTIQWMLDTINQTLVNLTTYQPNDLST